jgi:SAM-dependent methyltransferase
MTNKTWQEVLLNRYYRSQAGWTDGTNEFHNLCRRFICQNARVLEVGPGLPNRTSAYLAKISRWVVGLDVDEAVRENRTLSLACVYDGSKFPFNDACFDVAVSDYVMEHLQKPLLLCEEINRVLVPGGIFIFRTPNIFHYVSVFSRFLPQLLSNWSRNLPGNTPAPHRTFHRFNSLSKCQRLLSQAGFQIKSVSLIEKEPSYGMKSRFLFFPMFVYERVVNSSEIFCHLRANILCAAKKP